MEDETNDEDIMGLVSNLKEFGFQLPDAILKLAIKKCNMNLEEALFMLTEEEKVNDLQTELRKIEENNSNQIVLIEQSKEKDDPSKQEEAKLNLIISNRSEYFELLFELLNLGIYEITNASWNLLIQIPVNK